MLNKVRFSKFVYLTVFASLAFVAFIAWPFQYSKGITPTNAYLEDIRTGLAEIALPVSADERSIDSAAENLRTFIEYRSGVVISQQNLELLKVTELESRQNSKTITPKELSNMLTSIAVNRIYKLSDHEIAYITENLRGFTAPGLSNSFQMGRSSVKLRSDGRGDIDADEFYNELMDLRDSNKNSIFGFIAANEINNEVTNKVDILSQASSKYFGSADKGLTPMQALLVVYSIAVEDQLLHNKVGLEEKLIRMQQGITRITGETYPSPVGHRAYGENGYLKSSPAKLILNDETVKDMISGFQVAKK